MQKQGNCKIHETVMHECILILLLNSSELTQIFLISFAFAFIIKKKLRWLQNWISNINLSTKMFILQGKNLSKKISSGLVKKYPGQSWGGLLFTAFQKYARVGSGEDPISITRPHLIVEGIHFSIFKTK